MEGEKTAKQVEGLLKVWMFQKVDDIPAKDSQSEDAGAKLLASRFHLLLRQSVETTEGKPAPQFSV